MSSVINISDAPEDPQVDTLKVAEYVGNNLLSSKLAPFFAKPAPTRKKLFEDGENMFTYFCDCDTWSKDITYSWWDLSEHLIDLCQGVFEKPATAMRRSLRLARPILLHDTGDIEHIRIHMLDGVCLHPTYMPTHLTYC